MASSVQVDKEIEDIRRTIAKMSKLLYKFYRNMENVTGRVDGPLNVFDSAMRGAREDVSKVRNDFSQVIVQFPSFFVYVAIFVVIEIMIVAILLFLFYKILETLLKMMRTTRNERRIIRGKSENEEMFSINIPQSKAPRFSEKSTINSSHSHQFRRPFPSINKSSPQIMEQQKIEMARPLLGHVD